MSLNDTDTGAEARYRVVSTLGPRPADVPALIEALFDESWRVRRLAADTLSAVTAPEALVAPLVEVLGRRGQPGARNAAATALAHLGAVAVAPLAVLLGHTDPDQRKFAADILAALGRQEAAPALIRALADGDVNVRAAAAEALGRCASASAVAPLSALLADVDPLIRVSALEGLTSLGAPPPLPVLAPLLEHPLTRRSAWRLLGRVQHRSAWALVVQALRHKGSRDVALLAMGNSTAPLPVDVDVELHGALAGIADVSAWLSRALAADDVERRVGALHLVRAGQLAGLAPQVAEAAVGGEASELCLHVLRALGPAGVGALLEGPTPLLVTASREGRAVAGEAVVLGASPRVVGPLVALLDLVEPEVTEIALRALGRSHSPSAIAPLLERLDDDVMASTASRALAQLWLSCPSEVKQAVGQRVAGPLNAALVQLWASVAGAEALPVIRRALHDEDDAVRAAGAEASWAAPLEAAGLLGLSVVDEAPRVRRGVARALVRLDGPTGRPLLERLLVDADASVVAMACRAVTDRGDAWAAARLVALVQQSDAGVVLAAAQALMALGAADDALLAKLLEHADGEVVKQVLNEGASRAVVVAGAAKALANPEWDVRLAAAQALQVSGTRAQLPAIEAALLRETDLLTHAALVTAQALVAAR